MISNNSDNPHQLWNCINRTLNREASFSLPTHDSIYSLYNSFSRHFKDTINKIQASFPNPALVLILIFHHPCTVLKPPSLTEIAKPILSFLNKSCELDHVPTILLKSCLHALIVPITKMINVLILSSGHSTNTIRFIRSLWHHRLFCSSWSPLWLGWLIFNKYISINRNKKLFQWKFPYFAAFPTTLFLEHYCLFWIPYH